MTPFAEKIRTINVGRPSRRQAKVTRWDTGNGSARRVEHWDDRVDVAVAPHTLRRPR